MGRMLTGYPLGMRLPGKPGLGGYWGVSVLLDGHGRADIRAGRCETEGQSWLMQVVSKDAAVWDQAQKPLYALLGVY